jgi:hypothetical protein
MGLHIVLLFHNPQCNTFKGETLEGSLSHEAKGLVVIVLRVTYSSQEWVPKTRVSLALPICPQVCVIFFPSAFWHDQTRNPPKMLLFDLGHPSLLETNICPLYIAWSTVLCYRSTIWPKIYLLPYF